MFNILIDDNIRPSKDLGMLKLNDIERYLKKMYLTVYLTVYLLNL